jgi:hypothetical protein
VGCCVGSFATGGGLIISDSDGESVDIKSNARTGEPEIADDATGNDVSTFTDGDGKGVTGSAITGASKVIGAVVSMV